MLASHYLLYHSSFYLNYLMHVPNNFSHFSVVQPCKKMLIKDYITKYYEYYGKYIFNPCFGL